MKAIRCETRHGTVVLERGFGGLRDLNRRLRNRGFVAGDEVSWPEIEADYAVKACLPTAHATIFPIERRTA